MIATYRIQLTPDLGFREVTARVPYFRRLGISHLYLSPITEAQAGSLHGYDVVDHNRIRQELGGPEGFEALLSTCLEHGLRVIIDFVPNHAGVGPANAYWQRLLAYGPHSPYAAYFDVDWEPLKPELRGKLLLPFLGRPYGQALDAGEISLLWHDDRLYAAYFDNRFALRPESYAPVLAALLPSLERTDAYWEAKELHEAYSSVSAKEYERAEAIHGRFGVLARAVDIDNVLQTFQGQALHEILDDQFWRLSYWKTAGSEINYRRFFDINGLVALRQENADVFFEAHRLLGQLLRNDAVFGVRIDHVDGLHDPSGYLARLRELGARHVWVEKILAPGETLPDEWPVEGTTGYEFMNEVMRALNWPGGEVPLERLYRHITRDSVSYEDIAHDSKRLVMATKLAGELSRLAYGLDRISEADYRTRDFTLAALGEALVEVMAAFDRYRTYLPLKAQDAERVIKLAVHRAQQRNPAFEPSVYSFIQEVLLYAIPEALREEREAWVGRFQQYTAPVAAKGIEDTAFYRYPRLLALNEVGGEPSRFSDLPDVFHARSRFRALRYPMTLLATATHDHKRGEDTRMRLLVLSELHEQWRRLSFSLDRASSRYRGHHGPAPQDSYTFYQTLIAIWESDPPEVVEERLCAYAQKAAREAKVRTSWVNPDSSYEADLDQFVRGMLHDRYVHRAVAPLAKNVARFGYVNSLAQLVLKLTAPGVPDFFQGTELLDLSLVDPDNRRPVDFELRQRILDELEPSLAAPNPATLRGWLEAIDPRLKMYIMAKLLRFRAEHEELLGGSYQSLQADGPSSEHVLSFGREGDGMALVSLVPRFPAHLEQRGGYETTTLILPHPGQWTDVLTGATYQTKASLVLSELPLPFAVLYARA